MYEKTNTTILFLLIHILFYGLVVSETNFDTIEKSAIIFFSLSYLFSLLIYIKEMFSEYPSTFPYLLMSYVPGTNIVIFIWEVLSLIIVFYFTQKEQKQS